MIKKGFRLYLVDNDDNDILLTYFDTKNKKHNTGLTFDETLSEEENNKYTLDFKILSNMSHDSLPPQFNLSKYFKIGRKLKLYIDDREKYILLIITSITPEGSAQNTTYNISASDYASYIFARNKVGLNFNSFEDQDFIEEGLETNVFQLANHILRKGDMQRINYPTTSNIESFNSREQIDLIDTSKIVENIATYNTVLPSGMSPQNITVKFSDNYTIIGDYVEFDSIEINTYTADSQGGSGDLIDFTILLGANGADDFHFLQKPYKVIEYTAGNTADFLYQQTYIKPKILITTGLVSNSFSVSADSAYPILPKVNYRPKHPSMFLISINNHQCLFRDSYLHKEDSGSLLIEYKDGKFSYSSNDYSFITYITGINVYYEIDEDSWVIDGDETLLNEKINLELSNSNIYNALVEIANLTNSYINFDYENKEISFTKKDSDRYRKNYVLSPDVNLENFSLDYDGDEFYSILHVTGGEDEYGLSVGLTPTIPIEALEFFRKLKDLSIESAELGFDEEVDYTGYYTRLFNWTGNEKWLDNVPETDPIYVDNLKFIEIANKVPYLDNFIIDLSYFRDNNLISEDSYSDIIHKIYNELRMINIEYQYQIRKKYEAEYRINEIENSILNLSELLPRDSGSSYSENEDKLIKLFVDGDEYPFFKSILEYSGSVGLSKKYLEYKKIVKDYIESRDETEVEIDKLTKTIKDKEWDVDPPKMGHPDFEEYTDLATKKSNLEADFEAYVAAVGDWEYNPLQGQFIKNPSWGKYCYIVDMFDKHLPDFNLEIPKSILENFKTIKKRKEDFWYNLKKEYGEYLIEGYYENSIETDPTVLYTQAKVYAEDYKQPKENYNVTYIDISQIIGRNLDLIEVGDIIKLRLDKLGILHNEKNEIQVTEINRELRSESGITLTVNKTQYKIIEKLLNSLK